MLVLLHNCELPRILRCDRIYIKCDTGSPHLSILISDGNYDGIKRGILTIGPFRCPHGHCDSGTWQQAPNYSIVDSRGHMIIIYNLHYQFLTSKHQWGSCLK